MMDLHIHRMGAGPPVLFVHGGFGDGWTSCPRQRALAGRWTVLLLDRRGYGESPPRMGPHSVEQEAGEIAEALGEGAHLVGSSYGGLLALLAAARRPEAVRSLTVVEPNCFAVARGHPDVEAFLPSVIALYRNAPHLTPEAFRAGFSQTTGMALGSGPLSVRQRRNIEATKSERGPWEVAIPLERLAATPFPKLAISGGWGGPSASVRDVAGRAFAQVCDALASALSAEHVVIAGAGHGVQYSGPRFNARLVAFLETGRV